MAGKTLMVKGLDARRMENVEVKGQQLIVRFCDGVESRIPAADLREKDLDLGSVRLINPFCIEIQRRGGGVAEMPWDFARAYGDQSFMAAERDEAKESLLRLGEHLRKIRLDIHLTQEAVAALVGLHRVTISRWEEGHQSPSFKHLSALARGLGVPLSLLMVPDLESKKEVSSRGV